jgi:putative MATE family efflux protein
VIVAEERKRKIESGLVQGKISGSIWKLAAPMMIGGALQDLFSMVDLYFVGKLGHIEVAALSIAGTVVAILMMLVQGIAVGTVALVAQFVGEKEYEKADEVMGQTFILGLIGAAIMYILRLFLVVPLLGLFGVSGEVLNLAAEYLEITFGWSIVIFFFVGINQALRGSGDARTPLNALILSNIINIFLDPMLIMGYGIFPQLGVRGSAIATVGSRGFGLIFLILHTLFGHSTVHLKMKCLKPNVALMRRIISIGSFASLQVLVREISFLFLMRLVSSFGDITLAAYGIGSRIRMFIMVPGFGFASAAAVLTGQNLGANQPKRAEKSAWRSVKYYEIIAIPIAIAFLIFAPNIVSIFNTHSEVIEIGSSFLRYLAVTFPFLAFSIVLGQAMNGAGDTRTPTIVNVIGQLLFRVPLAYIFALALDMGQSGIWLGINASDIVQGIGMVFIFRSGHWIKVYTRNRKKMELRPLTLSTDAGLPSSGAEEAL